MSKNAVYAVAVMLVLTACDPVDGKPGASPVMLADDASHPRREQIVCSEHYAQVREAILGTLRGTESLPLITVVTRVSSTVLDGTVSLLNADCSFDNRKLQESRSPVAAPATPLQGRCAALVERIDTRCLQPLVERGEPLDKHCHLVLVAIADQSQKDVLRKMSSDQFCASMQEDL